MLLQHRALKVVRDELANQEGRDHAETRLAVPDLDAIPDPERVAPASGAEDRNEGQGPFEHGAGTCREGAMRQAGQVCQLPNHFRRMSDKREQIASELNG